MSGLYLHGVDIEPYMPLRVPDSAKENIYNLACDISARIDARLPIALRYHDTARVASPHSIYLQHRHLPQVPATTRKPSRYPWEHPLHNGGARRTIATDTFQTAEEGPISRKDWRTFHLDKVDEHRLLSFEEICEIFLPEGGDPRALENYFTTPVPASARFVKHYSHGVRHFLSQTSAQRDQLPRVIR